MKTKPRAKVCLLSTAMLLLGVDTIVSAEIIATVREVSGGAATVTPEGDLLPNVGDKAHVFFKMAGTEDEISVGAGQVQKIEGNSVTVAVAERTGDLAKDQLVRITSTNPQKRSAAAALPPAGKADGETPDALVGRWSSKAGNDEITLVFRSDGTAVLTSPSLHGAVLSGKYSLAKSGTGRRFHISKMAPMPPPGLTDEEVEQFQRGIDAGVEQSGGGDWRNLLWVGEVEYDNHILLQAFPQPADAAHVQFSSTALRLTKVAPGEGGPVPASPTATQADPARGQTAGKK